MGDKEYIAERRIGLQRTLEELRAQIARHRLEMQELQEAAHQTVGALLELDRWERRMAEKPAGEPAG
jgi:hypothetical protein